MINIEGTIIINNLSNLLDKIITDEIINNLQKYINSRIDISGELDLKTDEDVIESWISDFLYDELSYIILNHILKQDKDYKLEIDTFEYEYDFLDEIINYFKFKLNINENTNN